MSDPPFVQCVAVVVGRLRTVKVAYWVQDVYPEIAAALGVLNPRGPLYRFLHFVSQRVIAACDLTIALGEQMVRSLVAGGAPARRTTYVHNWADTSAIVPIPPEENRFLRANDLRGKFVVEYSGNAGRGHVFEALCEVMQRVSDDPRIQFIFIGGGIRLADIRDYAASNTLGNVRFFDYQPRSELAHSLSAASVSVVTEDPAVVGLLVPSKTYGILASGRPLLFVGSKVSDVAMTIVASSCGIVVAPDAVDELESVIRRLVSNPEEVSALGRRARLAAEEAYGRKDATARLGSLFRGLADGQPTPAELPR